MSDTKSSNRLFYVDNLRGFLIILVVLGHCIQHLDIDFDHNIVFRYICSFHMPLFMFISGFVSYKREYHWTSIKRRFIQLVIPFIAWAMVSMSLKDNWNIDWLTTPDTALWFLWVLFWIGSYYIALSKLSAKYNIAEEIMMALSCIIFMGVLFFSKLSFGYHLFAWYLPFYCMGAMTRKYDQVLSPILHKSVVPLLLLFLVSAFFWMRTESPTFMHTSSQAVIFTYKFIVGIIGCYAFLGLMQLYNAKVLIICEIGGGMTLGIYAIHQSIISILMKSGIIGYLNIENLIIQVLVIFILAFLITLGGYWLLKQSAITSRLFLGK